MHVDCDTHSNITVQLSSEHSQALSFVILYYYSMPLGTTFIVFSGYTKEFQLKRGTLDYKCILIDDAEDLTPGCVYIIPIGVHSSQRDFILWCIYLIGYNVSFFCSPISHL